MADTRVHREKGESRQRQAKRRRNIHARQAVVQRDNATREIAVRQVRVLVVHRRIDRGAEQLLGREYRRQLRRRSVEEGAGFVVERLVSLVERRRRERPEDVARPGLDDAVPPRRLVDVLVIQLLREHVREVVETHARARIPSERLGDGAGELITRFRRQRRGDA